MTTIAWDGETLAADRCSWSSGTRRTVRKVFKLRAPDGRHFLVGLCGDAAYATAVLRWMRGESERPNPSAFVVANDLNAQCAVVVDERRRVWTLPASLVYVPSREKVFASGGGQEFAWGALEAGATAVQAIRIAAKRSDYAGLGVDAVRFTR